LYVNLLLLVILKFTDAFFLYFADTYIWSKKETLLLISLYKENEAMFTSEKTKQHSCWEYIAKKITEKGYNISGKKCCTKFQTLKRTCKQIKNHNNKSENSRKTWEFLDVY